MSGGRPPATLKARALACVAQREHSRTELRRKLLSHLARASRAAAESGLRGAGATEESATEGGCAEDNPPPDAEQQVDQLLDWLAEKDLLSAERFVETRVSARSGRFGNQRIRQELAQHGVELDVDTAEQLKLTEQARAHAVWAKRFGAVAPDAAGRAKQMRFLAARGFGAEAIRRIVEGRDEGGRED